jgi:hypothetical protein
VCVHLVVAAGIEGQLAGLAHEVVGVVMVACGRGVVSERGYDDVTVVLQECYRPKAGITLPEVIFSEQ